MLETLLDLTERNVLAVEHIDRDGRAVDQVSDSRKVARLNGRAMPSSMEVSVVVAMEVSDRKSGSAQERGAEVLHRGE
jgi:hypothetical protein